MMSARTKENIVSIKATKESCIDCKLRKFCLAAGLNAEEIEDIAQVTRQRRPSPRGDHIFDMGGRFDRFYVVRSGSIKTYVLTPDGREQIIGFHLPGDTVGFDSMGSKVHASCAETLETTSLCELRLDCLAKLKNPSSVMQRLLNLAGKQVRSRDKHITLLGKESADQRLASFLVDLSDQFKALGYSPDEFNLSMSRADIGNFLSLALETVSRLFAKLSHYELINVERRRVRIVEPQKLRDFANTSENQDDLHLRYG